MNNNDISKNKAFGFNLIISDVELSSLASHISNDYALLLRREKDVDIINFEVQYVNIVATVLEIINPYLENFKLVLMMEELPPSTALHGGW